MSLEWRPDTQPEADPSRDAAGQRIPEERTNRRERPGVRRERPEPDEAAARQVGRTPAACVCRIR